jgi:CBS domain containing-hemolysin-like protein
MTSDNSDTDSKNSLIYKIKKLFNFSSKNADTIYDTKAYENLDSSRQEMVQGIFELTEQIARDVMIPRVDLIAIDSEIELKPLVKKVTEAGHSRFPVYENTIDNIVGILHVKDLLKFILEAPKKFSLKKIMREVYFVPESTSLNQLFYEFKKRKQHLAIIVDEYGGVGGLVTIEDILEVIVGDIGDEYDDETIPEFVKIKNNFFEFDSRMTIDEFNEESGLSLPSDDFDTIGGFVFDLFGKIPELNEQIEYQNIVFKIKDIKGTVINRIALKINSE